jgi:hypothetical protein
MLVVGRVVVSRSMCIVPTSLVSFHGGELVHKSGSVKTILGHIGKCAAGILWRGCWRRVWREGGEEDRGGNAPRLIQKLEDLLFLPRLDAIETRNTLTGASVLTRLLVTDC